MYHLPVGAFYASNISTPPDHVIGGWELATIGTWNSGLWMGVNTGLVQTGNVRIPARQRPVMDFGGDRRRLWFIGSFDPSQASNVTGNLNNFIPENVATAGPRFPTDHFHGRLE